MADWLSRFFVEGQGAGLELLKQGLCWVYEKYVGEASVEIQTSHRTAQLAAQSGKLGLWWDPNPVPPWEWRKEKRVTPKSQPSWVVPHEVFDARERDDFLSLIPLLTAETHEVVLWPLVAAIASWSAIQESYSGAIPKC